MEWTPQDVDAALAKVGRPSCTVGGRTYVGRILSIEEFAPFQEAAEGIGQGDELGTLVELFRDYGHTIFDESVPPKPWHKLHVSARAWRDQHDPTEALLALPPTVAMQVFTGFFETQLAAMDFEGAANLTRSRAPSKNSKGSRRRAAESTRKEARRGRRSRSPSS